jgi:hypothetical protein
MTLSWRLTRKVFVFGRGEGLSVLEEFRKRIGVG